MWLSDLFWPIECERKCHVSCSRGHLLGLGEDMEHRSSGFLKDMLHEQEINHYFLKPLIFGNCLLPQHNLANPDCHKGSKDQLCTLSRPYHHCGWWSYIHLRLSFITNITLEHLKDKGKTKSRDNLEEANYEFKKRFFFISGVNDYRLQQRQLVTAANANAKLKD